MCHGVSNFFESSSIVGFSISIIIIIMQSNFDIGSVISKDDFFICNETLLQGKRNEIFDFAELLLSSSISPQEDGNLALVVGSNWR